MRHTTFRDFAATIEDAAHDIVRACRRVLDAILVMPWPALLACCIGLALLISILPLALLLFVLFLAVKLVVGAFVIARHRDLRAQADGPAAKP